MLPKLYWFYVMLKWDQTCVNSTPVKLLADGRWLSTQSAFSDRLLLIIKWNQKILNSSHKLDWFSCRKKAMIARSAKTSNYNRIPGHGQFIFFLESGLTVMLDLCLNNVIVEILRRENQLNLWLLFRIFWFHLIMSKSLSENADWVLSHRPSARASQE